MIYHWMMVRRSEMKAFQIRELIDGGEDGDALVSGRGGSFLTI